MGCLQHEGAPGAAWLWSSQAAVGGWISVVNHWPEQDAPSQAKSPLYLEDWLDNKLYAPINNWSTCLTYYISNNKGASCFILLIKSFFYVRDTQELHKISIIILF